MTLRRIAVICFCIVIASAIAAGQSRRAATGQRAVPVRSLEPYEVGDPLPAWHVETRTTSGGREIVVETVESLNIDGRPAPFSEVVTETSRTGPNTEQTRRDVFGFTQDRRRELAWTTESREDSQPNGDRDAVFDTWAPDLNGHRRVRSRFTEQTRSIAPDVRQTDTTLLLPNINDGNNLQPAERTEHTARRVNPSVVRHESTYSVRDINGGWRPVEIRGGEVRENGASERVEEVTIQRPDLNGKLAIAQTDVIRRTKANEQEHVLIETYAPYLDRVPDANGRPPLSQRIHVTTTATADGGSYSVEEVEARSPISPSEPMRVIRRIVTTVRSIGADQWETKRQVFEPDLDGRMQLIRNE